MRRRFSGSGAIGVSIRVHPSVSAVVSYSSIRRTISLHPGNFSTLFFLRRLSYVFLLPDLCVPEFFRCFSDYPSGFCVHGMVLCVQEFLPAPVFWYHRSILQKSLSRQDRFSVILPALSVFAVWRLRSGFWRRERCQRCLCPGGRWGRTVWGSCRKA